MPCAAAVISTVLPLEICRVIVHCYAVCSSGLLAFDDQDVVGGEHHLAALVDHFAALDDAAGIGRFGSSSLAAIVTRVRIVSPMKTGRMKRSRS